MLAFAIAATLVSALPTSDGLVVCADRRSESPGYGHSEDFRKVYPAGPGAVFAVNGVVTFVQADRMVFDAREATTKLIAQHGLPKTRDEYHVVMKELVDEFATSGATKMAIPAQFTAGGPLFTITFYSLDGTQPKITALGVFFTPGVSTAPDIRIREITNGMNFSGQSQLATEMLVGHDSRFDDVRREYQRLWGEGRRPSPRVAIEFSRRFIREGSKRTQLLTNEPVNIGESADCASVSHGTVKWFLTGTAHK